MNGDNCQRIKKVIGGGNYYITVGTDSGSEFIQATIPRENDLENHNERVAVDNLCEWLTNNKIYGDMAVACLVDEIRSVRRKRG